MRLDSQLITDAARELGHIDTTQPPAVLLRAVLRKITGSDSPRAAAAGGAPPRRAGRAWEKTIVTMGQEAGFDGWDLAPLRGSRDLLDVNGCVPDGWLIGGKAVARGVSAAEKLSAAMDQAERALHNLQRRSGVSDDVIPFQILQRPGATPQRAYAVTEYQWFLKLATMRRKDWSRAIAENAAEQLQKGIKTNEHT